MFAEATLQMKLSPIVWEAIPATCLVRDICDAQKYDKLVIRSKEATDQATSTTTFGKAYHSRVSTIATGTRISLAYTYS